MSILTLASGASASRGYEYYRGKKVLRAEQIGETKYQGRVLGRGGAYDVLIDTAHARSSSCTCPHAAGTRKICKHMVALYEQFLYTYVDMEDLEDDDPDDWEDLDESDDWEE